VGGADGGGGVGGGGGRAARLFPPLHPCQQQPKVGTATYICYAVSWGQGF
jgi:hypothetical protein